MLLSIARLKLPAWRSEVTRSRRSPHAGLVRQPLPEEMLKAGENLPGGHFKIPHLWPVKIPHGLDRTG
jgi:hypothetical protein